MSLRARLRIAIVALVALVVIAMSILYLYDFTRVSLSSASDLADLIADQVKGNLMGLLPRETSPGGIHPNSPGEWKDTWTRVIQDDPKVEEMLKRALESTNLALAILVTDESGKVLASSNPAQKNTAVPPSRDFADLKKDTWISNLRDLMNRREDYSTTRSIGAAQQGVLFRITVVFQSVLLKHNMTPALEALGLAFGASLFIAIFLGSVLPNVILGPLERVSRNIDLIRSGEYAPAVSSPRRESREFADVQSKLSLLGEQFRGAKQDVSELRTNVDQLLQRLEEAVLLFDNSGRLIIAGETAERMLGMSRDRMIGHGIDEIFPVSTLLGATIGSAVTARRSLRAQPVTVSRGDGPSLRWLVTVQVLRKDPGAEDIGTLIRLRDAESRRQLELQLDVSSRLAAISRLTGGVAHEIKNPLNAMALHLEVLRGRMDGEQPELDVIASEIKRLDGVVKTFLNFNRPIDLKAEPIDLSTVLEQVLALVSVEAKAKNIEIEAPIQRELWINGDPDLLKQAILNIVNNGMDAMAEGGKLTVLAEWDGRDCQVAITDTGSGIAPTVRDRIFHLYFTTKAQGSGIGLATTFRVVQLHSGTIDFVSESGRGTTFRLRFPGMTEHGEALTSATGRS